MEKPNFVDALNRFSEGGDLYEKFGGGSGFDYDDWYKFKFDNANALWQTDWNAYQAELAFEREKQLINEQNAYNSPSNQLARYMEAGLNPSLIYGQISPGLQSQTASYTPSRPGDFTAQALPGKTEKLNRVLSIISAIAGVVGQAANVAGAVEGVKNQNLQNQMIEAQLPSVKAESNWNQFLNLARFQQFHDSGAFPSGYIEGLGDFGKILFPDYYKSSSLGVKSAYQQWWNEVIAPLYKQWYEGRTNAQDAAGNIQQYNLQALESMPPALRPYFSMMMQVLQFIK